ncbi:MAG: phosphate acyltransferase PlsX [Anaerolineales bacterium]|nr:phosphate acyltransferase PlsX [Anaerolineales bacterium]
MKIVLDAMGGDHAPPVAVEGGVWAAREYGIEVILVGREADVRRELARHDTSGLSLPIVHASQVIEMEEHPAAAVKAKKDSSMVVGMDMVKRGEAEAFVTMGNSGGALAAALFRLGRIRGIKRPALSTIYPTTTGFCFMLDVGANTDCKPEYLLQFAYLGVAYAERVLEIANPRVGIVSNGEEETKGSILVQEAHQLLKNSGLNFIGNVEGKDIPAGMADVVVTDGFTGNVIAKLSEGLAASLLGIIKDEVKKRPLATVGALLSKPAFDQVKKRLDYAEFGGAPLLGVDGVVIVGHGRSNAKAVKNAVRVAKQAVEGEMLAAIKEGLQSL